MTVSVVSFPAGIYPDDFRLTPDVGPGQSVTESPFIGAQTVVTYRGAERWKLEMRIEDLTSGDRADIMAFITKLRVAHNVFLCTNFAASNRGVLSGTPMSIGSLSGNYLVVGNLGASVSSWARAGDFISVNSQMKMVLDNVGTSGGGVCSLYVWPPLYDVPLSGALVKVSSPVGAFRLTAPVALYTEPPGLRTSVSISAVERINSSFVSDFL